MAGRPAQKLTLDEKQKHEFQKEIFITIRLIDMVEKCANLSDDKITPEKHQQEITKLLERLDNFSSKVPSFSLDKFVEEYNLEDCKFGIDRIKTGPPKIKKSNNIQLVKELMQKFFQIQDIMLTQSDNPKVASLKPQAEQLITLLTKAEKELPPYNSYLKEFKEFYSRGFEKQLMDNLSEVEFQEFNTIIDLAQTSFMNSNQ